MAFSIKKVKQIAMTTKGRFQRAMDVVNELSTLKFTEKDIRGLSKCEKQFIIENDYNVVLNQENTIGTNGTLYMFIERNRLGKKQLYAITKKQSVRPNSHDISQSAYNYECWLLFDAERLEFSKYNYERRFCKVPNVRLIFA